MKTCLYTFLLSLVLLMTTSCSSDDSPAAVAVSINPSSMSFTAAGGTVGFTAVAGTRPSFTTDASWLTVSAPKSALFDANTWTAEVTAAKNPVDEPRTGTVTVSCGDSSATITVTQEAGEPKPAEPVEPEKPELPAVTEYPHQEPLNLTARDIARDIVNGINIGNTLEAINGTVSSETAWGNPKINENYIQGLKNAGFNAVRIPCAWDGYIIDRNNNAIDPAWLDRVCEVVEMVVSRDMYAIVNIHWDGGWLENSFGGTVSSNELAAKQSALWTQIATRLKGFNERLMFAGTNEPAADTKSKVKDLIKYEQAFIDAVRATGGNNTLRTLIFQGPVTNIDKTVEFMTGNLPVDSEPDRLMAEIHFYDPWQFAGLEKDETWGKSFWFWGKQNHQADSDRNTPDWGEEESMKAQFDKMKTMFVDKGIPVVLGEYGAIVPASVKMPGASAAYKDAYLASRVYYDGCTVKFAKERGLIPFLWDTGEIFDRNDGHVKVPAIVDAIIKE